MEELGKQSIDSVLLEGGGTLNECALHLGLVNRVEVYIAPKLFGGSAAKSPIEGKGVSLAKDAYGLCLKNVQKVGEDILLEYDVNKRGE